MRAALRELEQAEAPQATEVPASYLEFCAWAGVELTAGQREVAAQAYDAVARLVVVALVVGRRGGKTYALIALRLLHGMLVRDVSSCAPGQVPTALVVAPNDTLRAEAFNYALGCVQAHDVMRSWLVRTTASTFELRRPDGAVVRFATGVATAGGYGARGRSLTDCAMDEAAFFRSRENKVNDEEIFRAAQPGLLPGGQMIVASSPWAAKGLLYELWTRNKDGARDAMVFKRTTLELRDTPELRKLAADLRARDPDAASREFDAEFMSASSEIFFPPELIESCVDDALTTRLPAAGEVVCAGVDLGLRSDSSALAIVHKSEGTLTVGELLELRPEPGSALKPSVVCRTFGERMREHGCSYAIADQHYREALVEYLTEYDVAVSDAPTQPADAFVRARALMREGRVRLPRNARLLQQLSEVEGRATSGGRIAITLPRWTSGGHCDLVSALVLALYQLGGEEVAGPEPLPGTEEWEEKQRAHRREQLQQRLSQDYWRGPAFAKQRTVAASQAGMAGRVARVESMLRRRR